MHPKTCEAMPLREDILTTLRRLGPLANKLGAQPALDHLYQAATDGSDATYLRRQYEVRGSCEGMVDAAIAQFRGGRR